MHGILQDCFDGSFLQLGVGTKIFLKGKKLTKKPDKDWDIIFGCFSYHYFLIYWTPPASLKDDAFSLSLFISQLSAFKYPCRDPSTTLGMTVC